MNARPARARSAPTTLATLSAVSRSTHNATATNPAPAAAHTAATVHHTHRRIRVRPLHQVPNGHSSRGRKCPTTPPTPGQRTTKRIHGPTDLSAAGKTWPAGATALRPCPVPIHQSGTGACPHGTPEEGRGPYSAYAPGRPAITLSGVAGKILDRAVNAGACARHQPVVATVPLTGILRWRDALEGRPP